MITELPEIDYNTLHLKSLPELDKLSFEIRKVKDTLWLSMLEAREIKYDLINQRLQAEIDKQPTSTIKLGINKVNKTLGHISIQMGRIRNAERILSDRKYQILRPS